MVKARLADGQGCSFCNAEILLLFRCLLKSKLLKFKLLPRDIMWFGANHICIFFSIGDALDK